MKHLQKVQKALSLRLWVGAHPVQLREEGGAGHSSRSDMAAGGGAVSGREGAFGAG